MELTVFVFRLIDFGHTRKKCTLIPTSFARPSKKVERSSVLASFDQVVVELNPVRRTRILAQLAFSSNGVEPRKPSMTNASKARSGPFDLVRVSFLYFRNTLCILVSTETFGRFHLATLCLVCVGMFRCSTNYAKQNVGVQCFGTAA